MANLSDHDEELENGGHTSPPPPNFTLKDEPVENFRPMRIIVIGAGFSGIYLGIRIPELLRNVELTIYEKNDGVGGAWWENRYPGCGCDIPAHSYVYTFEPNRNWSSFYAPAKEIQQYLELVCKKYSADRFIQLGHKVASCIWDEKKLKWKVEIEKTATGETFKDEADVVINARGALNNYTWPDVEGLNSFKGKLMHSAAWDESFDFTNKRVGVIGGGSSAIQIVPALQKREGVKLTCFARSKTWISQSFGDGAMKKLKLDGEKFTPENSQKFMADDVTYHSFRKVIETEGNAMHPISLKGSAMSEGARRAFTELMRKRLAKKPELLDYLLPAFAPGCRRLTPGPGYLEALTQENVSFNPSPIRAVHTSGVEVEDGRIIELDALVCATGFDAMGPPPFPIVGIKGRTIKDRFEPYPEAYMGIAVDGFPNYFLMLGPNSGVASGSLTAILEKSGDYIIKCIRKLQKEDIPAMTISPSRMQDWISFIDAYFTRTVFLDECRSWYRRGNRIVGLWPGSTLHAMETLRSPRWEDFDYIFANAEDEKKNRLGWLGNGWSELQMGKGDMSFYIEPEFVDFPSAPLPEKTNRWMTLSFSQ